LPRGSVGIGRVKEDLQVTWIEPSRFNKIRKTFVPSALTARDQAESERSSRVVRRAGLHLFEDFSSGIIISFDPIMVIRLSNSGFDQVWLKSHRVLQRRLGRV